MSTEHDDDGPLAKFGDALSWALMQAIEAYGRQSPEDCKALVDQLAAGDARLELIAVVGGGEANSIEVIALLPDGERQLLAAMHVAKLKLN